MSRHRFRWNTFVITASLLALFCLAIFLKSGYYQSMPFLPDGDTYFHGMLSNYIVEYGKTTIYVPYEVPQLLHGYPFNFHILIAQIHYFTGLPVLTILRWFGPISSAFIGLAVYLLTRRLTKSPVAGLFAFFLSLFVPFLSARLSGTFPENVMILFVPLLLIVLHDAVDNRRLFSLLCGLLFVVSSIGYHFSSYLLVPVLGIGVLIYYSGRRWRWRNLVYIGIFLVGLLVLVSTVYSPYWLFGFITSLFKTYSGSVFTPTSPLRGYALPAPDTNQWFDQLGTMPVILAMIGTGIFILSRKVTWRTKAVLLSFGAVILLPLQVLPLLKLFSYTPFRAFVYIAIPLLIMSGVSIAWLERNQSRLIRLFVVGVIIMATLPNYNTPARPGPGEQHLTKGEFLGIQWLQQQVSGDSVVVTAPANGRQVAFYTKASTAYDTSQPVFDAVDGRSAVTEIGKLGSFRRAYIYISKYKLGPVYNYGEIREYAFVKADLKKFEDQRYFRKVFDDKDSEIFEMVSSKN